MSQSSPGRALPYRLACLCDLRDSRGRVLLLRRARPPNQHLHSPIGGKLDMTTGESPAQCARREIREEAGIDVPIDRLHLAGLISESAYEGGAHWLLFFYRVLGAVDVPAQDISEGRLEWHTPAAVEQLMLPDTDRRIIWPLVRRHDASAPGERPGFFAVHIDCTAGEDRPGAPMRWRVEQSSAGPPGDWQA